MPRATEPARDVCSGCGRGVRADLLDGGLCWDCAPGWRGRTRQRTRCPVCCRRYGLDGYPCIRCQVDEGVRSIAVAEWINVAVRGAEPGPFPAAPREWERRRACNPAGFAAYVRELVADAASRARRGSERVQRP